MTSSARASSDERDGQAKRLGGLEVDHQFEFRGLLDRQVGRLLAFENAAGVDAGLTIAVRKAGSIAHQAAGRGELAKLIDRRYPVAERQCGELFAPDGEEAIGADHKRAGPHWTKLAKAESMSRSVLACRTWSSQPEGAAPPPAGLLIGLRHRDWSG